MKSIKNKIIILIIFFMAAPLLTACSGGGGSSSVGNNDDSPSHPASVDATGTWKGDYSSTVFGDAFATLIIQQFGNEISGTHSSSTGSTGSLSGYVSENKAIFTMTVTTPGCSGIFSGTAIIHTEYEPAQMNFQYDGSSTCGGKEGGSGILINLEYINPNLDQEQLSYSGSLEAHTLPGDSVWQSFTAGVTGTLIRIDLGFFSNMSGSGQLQILEGEGINGMILQTLTVPMVCNSGLQLCWMKWKDINVQVTAGHQYTFNLIPNADSIPDPYKVAIRSGDPYPGGTSTRSGSDFMFRTYVLP